MKINFIAADRMTELIVEPPIPAKNAMPNWYKNTPRYLESNRPVFNNGMVNNDSVKACLPFFDALTAGYIQKTWCDIHFKFKYDNDNLVEFDYNYSLNPQIIEHRQEASVPIPNQFHPVEFTWKIPWLPIMPPGWSCLFVSPFNHIDIPFFSLSGIIDSDVFYHTPQGNYPFWVKKEIGDKIIPAGTPMYQIIPFKRENWISKTKIISDEQRLMNLGKIKKHFVGSYKKLFHQKKTYK